MKPVLHRIFVIPDEVEQVDEVLQRAKAAGIHVEVDKKEQKAVVRGTVVAIGNTAFLAFNTTAGDQGISVGGRVIYAKYSGADVPNTNMIVLNDEDIIGVDE